MKSKSVTWVAACLLGSALCLPPAIFGAEKDMMKDDKGMMKEGKDAKMKEKTKDEKKAKGAMADEKMKMDDKMKMDQKKK
ncbi:MAG TPA: hypothetical protein VEG60_09075 [Candidatus Binatia bacterium]|nr:hypothetical protein [Candidatus Binatia bacterium]